MTSRERRYHKWCRYVKAQERFFFESYSYKLEYNQAMESFLENSIGKTKRNLPMDIREMFGNTNPDVDGFDGFIPVVSQKGVFDYPYNPEETFMGLIPYVQAKVKGEPVSEFQDRCWKCGIGLDKNNA